MASHLFSSPWNAVFPIKRDETSTPKAKRNQLILVIVGTLALIGMVYFFLIGPQNEENHKLTAETSTEAGQASAN